jgi:hypothetical protein
VPRGQLGSNSPTTASPPLLPPQRDLAPQRGPLFSILPEFCGFVEILYVQNNLACYGLAMRQPAHGCNIRAKRRLTHFILTFLS